MWINVNIWKNIFRSGVGLLMLSLFGKKMTAEVLPYWNANDIGKSKDANFDSICFNNFRTINDELV
jgi:hypothetical protein